MLLRSAVLGLLVIGLTGWNASASDLWPPLEPFETASEGEETPSQVAGTDYYDYVDVRRSNGERQYVYSRSRFYRSHSRLGEFGLSAEYRDRDTHLLLNNLDRVSDYFEYRHRTGEFSVKVSRGSKRENVYAALSYNGRVGGSFSLSRPLGKGALSASTAIESHDSRFSYDVHGATGSIPIAFHLLKAEMDFRVSKTKLHLSYRRLLPDRSDGPFYTKIKGHVVGLDLSRQLGWGSTLHAAARYGGIRAQLTYGGEAYGHLDDLRGFAYLAENEVLIGSAHRLALGVVGLSTWVGDGSYFDIWPFTYWDAFMARRTRLDEFDLDIFMPFTAYRYTYERRVGGFELTIRPGLAYYHFVFESDIDYRERYFVLYPFIMDYRPETLDVGSAMDGIVRLALRSRTRYGKLIADLTVSQLIPVDFARSGIAAGGSDSASSVPIKEEGGFHLSASLGYNF
jgi:hypothetical protein